MSGFLVQHWKAMVWGAETELYAGEGARALDILDRDQRALRRSFLMHVQFLRATTAFVRGAGARGVARGRARAPARAHRRGAADRAQARSRGHVMDGGPLAASRRRRGECMQGIGRRDRGARGGDPPVDRRRHGAPRMGGSAPPRALARRRGRGAARSRGRGGHEHAGHSRPARYAGMLCRAAGGPPTGRVTLPAKRRWNDPPRSYPKSVLHEVGGASPRSAASRAKVSSASGSGSRV